MFMEIVGKDSVKTWRQIIGATDPAKADVNSLRAKYGVDATRNAFHGSASPEEANNEIRKVFALRPACAPEGTPTSVIVIEPTFKAQYPDILKELFYEINKRPNIHISGIHTCDPVAADIDELFKAYQGVVPNWRQYCDAFDDGVCIAFELVGEDVIAQSRDICGPFDPEIAKLLKPDSIRAKFGVNCV